MDKALDKLKEAFDDLPMDLDEVGPVKLENLCYAVYNVLSLSGRTEEARITLGETK